MSSPQLMQGMHQDLTCTLCLELFRSPVTPECGHTFCQACLIGSPKAEDQNGATLCPTCQAPSRPESLRINQKLEHLVESFKKVPQGHCQEHMDPLSVFCEQDKELICGVCASLGKHKGHNIITAAEAHGKMKRQLPQQQVILQEARLRKEKTVALLDRQVAEVQDTVSRFKKNVKDQLNIMRSYLNMMETSLGREADKADRDATAALVGERNSMAHYMEQLRQMEGILQDVEGQEQTEFLRKYCVVSSRLNKILGESPPPGRLDIQLPVISDEFKFQVWRKMFRALMPPLENLTLDPDTAQQNLVVSEDGKTVECSDHKQAVSDEPGRFDKSNCLVTKESFTEGEHYWEVVVEDKPRWSLGIISETANRKGKLHASPSHGFWILGCKDGKVYEIFAEAKEPRLLRVDGRPEKIGIYLSFSDGVVSFFDADDEDNIKLLYTFHERFSCKLYPFFDVCWHDKGKNAQPLKIFWPTTGQS
ncbi:tripartite motif-containing protein 72 [Bombina bombina]|uniref:tripartite motif-containing protein 72 n=1 Tax=Bombina bombina TaxID=8345 RepID=UPI00235B10A4|nr:tripartite motif-containing protein 72 [Bombina bombina]XP_053550284.1 tripartite motif-containing protein 72 [Bombina bombina]XP_053550285.1 tripartite motif-containing protein 72 [Bombina bombina]